MEKGLVVATGGTKGIGRAIIEKFASKGYDIATCSRNEEDLNALKETIENEFKVLVTTLKADLSKKEDVLKFSRVIESLGLSVEVLVNNTGTFIPGQIHTEEDGTLETLINTNLYSAYWLSREVIPLMKAQKKGHIFNICSIASIAAYANGGSYAISKFAMYGMSKCLREELKDEHIKVTSVLPGATFTASWEGMDLSPDRLMKSEDVAESVWSAFSLSGSSVVEEMIIRPQLGDL